MKSIKMLGLAALAALTAMAFVGASSAMAESTALCKLDSALLSGGVYQTTDACPAGELITHVHETTLAGAPALLHTNLFDIECNVLFLGDVLSANNLGSPLIISGTLSISSCTHNCIAIEENGPGEIKLLREGHETAKVTVEFLLHLECGAAINCTYNGEGLVGTGKGPLLSGELNSEVTFNAKSLKREGSVFTLCPKEAKLTIIATPLNSQLEQEMGIEGMEGAVYLSK